MQPQGDPSISTPSLNTNVRGTASKLAADTALGHVQVLLNKLRGFSAQASLDAPRFCISAGLPDAGTANAASAGDIDSEIWFEDGIPPEVIDELRGERGSDFSSWVFALLCDGFPGRISRSYFFSLRFGVSLTRLLAMMTYAVVHRALVGRDPADRAADGA
jgi:hypothetical protein